MSIFSKENKPVGVIMYCGKCGKELDSAGGAISVVYTGKPHHEFDEKKVKATADFYTCKKCKK